MAFATFLVWRLRTGAYGVGAYGFRRYRMPPSEGTDSNSSVENQNSQFCNVKFISTIIIETFSARFNFTS